MKKAYHDLESSWDLWETRHISRNDSTRRSAGTPRIMEIELNAVRAPEGNACEGASTAGTFVNPVLRSAPLSDISRSFDF